MLTYIYNFIADQINTNVPWLPVPAMLLFNRPTRGILPKVSRQPVLCDNDKSNLIALLERHPRQAKT